MKTAKRANSLQHWEPTAIKTNAEIENDIMQSEGQLVEIFNTDRIRPVVEPETGKLKMKQRKVLPIENNVEHEVAPEPESQIEHVPKEEAQALERKKQEDNQIQVKQAALSALNTGLKELDEQYKQYDTLEGDELFKAALNYKYNGNLNSEEIEELIEDEFTLDEYYDSEKDVRRKDRTRKGLITEYKKALLKDKSALSDNLRSEYNKAVKPKQEAKPESRNTPSKETQFKEQTPPVRDNQQQTMETIPNHQHSRGNEDNSPDRTAAQLPQTTEELAELIRDEVEKANNPKWKAADSGVQIGAHSYDPKQLKARKNAFHKRGKGGRDLRALIDTNQAEESRHDATTKRHLNDYHNSNEALRTGTSKFGNIKSARKI